MDILIEFFLCEYFVGDVIVNEGTYINQIKPITHTLLQSYIKVSCHFKTKTVGTPNG